jgi:uncharacterized protein (TIGR00730 family)
MSMQFFRTAAATAAILGAAAGTAQAQDLTAVGLTADGRSLVEFSTDKPQQASAPRAIGGLGAGETVVGIDRRPRNGELFAVTSASRLLVINEQTGAGVERAVLSVPLSGTAFGVDFNPTVDRLRIISDADQNLRVVPDTGVTTPDGTLAYAPDSPFAGSNPAATAAAYTNNDNDNLAGAAGPTGTQLFDLETAQDQLVLQAPPNNGVLAAIGALTKDPGAAAGFDIFSDEVAGRAVADQAFAVFGNEGQPKAPTKLYEVDLGTGQATPVGPFDVAIADLASRRTLGRVTDPGHPREPTSADEELLEADSAAIVSQLDDEARVRRMADELRMGFDALRDVRGHGVSVFGSARTPPDHPQYAQARDLARRLGEAGFAIITGGGPGAMEAANRGARDAGVLSIGLGIELPHEQGINPYVDLPLEFHYFFTRKIMFVRYARAFVVLPGGLGTFDELFEAWTLVQTQKVRHFPIVLFGSAYWEGLVAWLKGTVLAEAKISPQDLDAIVTVTDDPDEVVRIVREAEQHRPPAAP